MHPEIKKRLTKDAAELIPLAEQKWADSLRSTITMNGAGVAGVLALLQALPEARALLVACAAPFAIGIMLALVAWLFTFSSDHDMLNTRFARAESVAKATLWCVGLFVLGVLAAFSVAVGVSSWSAVSCPPA